MYPWRTPERIRGRHLANQGTHLVWDAWAAEAVAALPRPEETDPAPVPRDDGVRSDDLNGRAPATSRLREPGPQHPVGRRDANTRASRSTHDGQLVSERDDLQVQRGAWADHELERVEQGDEDGRHEWRLSKHARNLNRRNAY
jgi:hypothetical protein